MKETPCAAVMVVCPPQLGAGRRPQKEPEGGGKKRKTLSELLNLLLSQVLNSLGIGGKGEKKKGEARVPQIHIFYCASIEGRSGQRGGRGEGGEERTTTRTL